jgi:hypothetical protein
MTSILSKISWTIWVVISLLLISASTTNLEITRGIVNSGFVYIFILGFVALMTLRKPWTRSKRLMVSVAIFGFFLIFKLYTDWRGDWKTQTIIYKNKHIPAWTIESQLQDKGALGYNKRIVERMKLFSFLSWAKKLTEEDLKTIDTLTWSEVNIYINEQGLKGG